VSFEEFIAWEKEHPRPWTLVQTDLAERGRVSTIFLGHDVGDGQGKPVLWETMVFGGPWDRRCWRDTSESGARERHRLTVDGLGCLALPAGFCYILDERAQPRPVGVEEFHRWRPEPWQLILATTAIPGVAMIATMFFGFDPDGRAVRPRLWRTLIFGGPWAQRAWAEPTCLRALARHRLLMRRLGRGVAETERRLQERTDPSGLQREEGGAPDA
jgi:hypothetical protein